MPLYKKTISLYLDAITAEDSEALLDEIIAQTTDNNPEIYDVMYKGQSVGGNLIEERGDEFIDESEEEN